MWSFAAIIIDTESCRSFMGLIDVALVRSCSAFCRRLKRSVKGITSPPDDSCQLGRAQCQNSIFVTMPSSIERKNFTACQRKRNGGDRKRISRETKVESGQQQGRRFLILCTPKNDGRDP